MWRWRHWARSSERHLQTQNCLRTAKTKLYSQPTAVPPRKQGTWFMHYYNRTQQCHLAMNPWEMGITVKSHLCGKIMMIIMLKPFRIASDLGIALNTHFWMLSLRVQTPKSWLSTTFKLIGAHKKGLRLAGLDNHTIYRISECFWTE